jgi:uncharacterized membrane protein
VTVAIDTPITDHRVERILAFMVLSAVGLSIVAFIAIIIGTGVGLKAADFSGGIWPVVFVLPLVGLPIGLVLMIALIIISGIRRGREAKDARK